MDYIFDDETDALMADVDDSMNLDPHPGLPDDDGVDQLMTDIIIPGDFVPGAAFPDDGVEATMANIPIVQEGYGMSDHHIRQLISIQPDGSRYSPRWKLTFDRYTVTVRDLKDVPASETPFFIVKILDYILEYVTSRARPDDRVRVCIDSPSLHYPIWTPAINRSQLTVNRWNAEVSHEMRVKWIEN